MSSALVEHQRIHLNNTHINYIRTENCAYCKYEKRKGYRADGIPSFILGHQSITLRNRATNS